MSKLSRGIFGTIAVSLTFGAIQFAPARDLTGIPQQSAAATDAVINRAAKTDRAAAVASDAQTRTIALRPAGMADTSVLVRLPVPQEARNVTPAPSAPSARKPGSRKLVACEPVVSVLTEVAKLLEPGRCVT